MGGAGGEGTRQHLVGWLRGFLLILESLRGWDFADLSDRWMVVWVSLTGGLERISYVGLA
jgi:hypothetical protein